MEIHPGSIWPINTLLFLHPLFQVNVVSSSLHAVLFYSQTVATSAHVRIVLFALEEHYASNHGFIIIIKILATVYGVWSL